MRTAPLSRLTSTAASSHHPGPLQQQTYASTAASSHLCGRREALRNAAVYLLAAGAVGLLMQSAKARQKAKLNKASAMAPTVPQTEHAASMRPPMLENVSQEV